MRKYLSISAAVVLLLSSSVPLINAQEWITPFFSDPSTEGIIFSTPEGPDNHHQKMTVEEELEYPFTIAIINFKGTTPPTISRFYAGDRNILSPLFTRESVNDNWLLQVNNRLDYETIDPDISFELTIPSFEDTMIKPRISITLLNIFDNAPRFEADGACMIDELQDPYLTDCSYTLFDADGLLNNQHTFRIDGQNSESEIFEFVRGMEIDTYQVKYNLATKKELLFVERELYSFTVYVTDVGSNTGQTRIIVEVDDVPNLPPKWTKSFVSDRFDEKQKREYSVEAIDGDTKINKRVYYALRFEDFEQDEDWTKQIQIDQLGGLITIEPLNRDVLKREVFNFYIIAYEFDDFEEQIESSATIILNDINDNLPLITIDTTTIHIWEETFETLDFERFFANDIDLGQNAQYTVELTEIATESQPYSTAFTIIPRAGYQEANFIVSVTNAGLLDYEEELWREFSIKVRAVEDFNIDRIDEKTFRVALDNWNDEEPIFDQAAYQFSVLETIGLDEVLGRVHADDRDVDDAVEYSIVGYLKDQIRITEDGELRTAVEELLDYERQTNVVVQITAKDTLRTEKVGEVLHTTYVQFTIDVLDVNDETPELRMPRKTPSIMENSAPGTVITDEIYATDPDTTATLVMSILWEESYATKNGRQVEPEEYEGCFIITADNSNRNRVTATISINPEFNDDVDYEKYEVLYLSIYVIDTATEVGIPDAVGVITVRIEDENDNAPVFVEGTDTVSRTVIEASLAQTVIGSVLATDADGPGFNEVRYSIESLEDTPEWVNIGRESGELTVASDQIDCDVPPREYLNFRITADDSLKSNFIDIAIFIIDTNNKPPAYVDFIESVSIYENQTEGLFLTVQAIDADRDEQYRDFDFQIDFSGYREQMDLFGMEEGTGNVEVQLKNGQELDRDSGTTQHVLTIVVTDHKGMGTKNSLRSMVTVILLDVNDNPPVLPSRDAFQPKVAENVFTGTMESQEMVAYRLLATDKDEGVNAEVSFRILSITAYEDNANPAPDITGVFEIKSERTLNRGTLVIRKSLQGFYGTWRIAIEAYDHGDEGDSQVSLSTTETYDLVIEPFNFNAPQITYPSSNEVIRLSYPQTVNGQLFLYSGNELPAFEAVDDDGGVFGEVEFKVTGSTNDEDHEYFRFVRISNKRYQLQITQATQDKVYNINVAAEDGGGKKEEFLDMPVVFVNREGNPIFTTKTFAVTIVENDPDANVVLPEATDPKNEQIYYFLQSSSDLFVLEKNTRVLSLKQALEWTEETETHVLTVIASNVESGPITSDENSQLTVTVTVEDVNDKPPKFVKERYGVGITTSDPVDKSLLEVKAIDPDKDDVVTYFLLPETMEASDSLSSVKDIAFDVDQATGQIYLRIKVLDSYKGYFTFTVQAKDLVDHTDETTVRVYIIAESNRVSFVFLNTRELVEDQKGYIGDVLGRHFNYDCYVDDIQPYDDGTAVTSGSIEVRAHFVNDDIAVEGDVIRARTSNYDLIAQIQNELREEGLQLYLIVDEKSLEELSNKEGLLRILLIVVTVIFAIICCALIVAFVLRTRSLNRQLKAFSTTEFGSVSSNLNRLGVPTTNVFSVEGSNPVMNNSTMKKSMFDEESIQSDDSDMIGFEDHPDFVKKGINGIGPESVNVARIQESARQNIKNPMANGTTKDFDKDNDSLTRF